MYVIYEDDYANTAMPSMDSDGRIEVIWDHPDFARKWSARWAPWPYDSPWQIHSLFDEKTSFDTWGAYAILLLHFGLFKVSQYLNPQKVIGASPDEILSFKNSIATETVRAKENLLEQFPSCFISHSSADTVFAHRIYMDLKTGGVRCWYAPEDLQIGADILTGIRKAIENNNRVLLILSKASIRSGWVQDEIAKVFAQERSSGSVKLFPIMIDDSAMMSDVAWVAKIRETRNIGDFRNWENEDVYKTRLKRVFRDLGA